MGAVIEIKREHLDRQPEPAPSLRMCPCRVLAASEGLAVAETPLGPRACRLAASCLPRPEPRDLVLAALPEEETPRPSSSPERAEAGSPAMFDLPAGAVLTGMAACRACRHAGWTVAEVVSTRA
ncbi:MAG: hypothetical protein AUJ49_10425 [Desulfovibrionaceae bacterium CG1_02_65_16]|nr:MAG: hypothetical protein AUJ49_10425 [Desulfovibrionaceae bacterium CG1_02_65_16]